ncbi:TIGR04141 family sporadically distributed protein [Streptomyces massasporeus]|uniref:TIGR04141 family sporadically distributed protein n=1 Tax=Streptomyces massasporeus TaxID=67324 RepID=UPI0033E5C24C
MVRGRSGYVDECRAAVATLFSPSPSVSLPAWIDGESENAYNNRVADEERPDWLCLDTKNVANPLRPRDQVEICDLLVPDGTLILVKRAGGSGPLSHLFSQARVAVELLQESARVRAEFTEKVARLSRGELVLSDDFTPKRIVLAMLLKDRENLMPDSVFGFSQITIAQTAKAAAARGGDCRGRRNPGERRKRASPVGMRWAFGRSPRLRACDADSLSFSSTWGEPHETSRGQVASSGTPE